MNKYVKFIMCLNFLAGYTVGIVLGRFPELLPGYVFLVAMGYAYYTIGLEKFLHIFFKGDEDYKPWSKWNKRKKKK